MKSSLSQIALILLAGAVGLAASVMLSRLPEEAPLPAGEKRQVKRIDRAPKQAREWHPKTSPTPLITSSPAGDPAAEQKDFAAPPQPEIGNSAQIQVAKKLDALVAKAQTELVAPQPQPAPVVTNPLPMKTDPEQSGWRYHGLIVLNGNTQAIFANASSGEMALLKRGASFRGGKIKEIRSDSVFITAADGSEIYMPAPPGGATTVMLPGTAQQQPRQGRQVTPVRPAVPIQTSPRPMITARPPVTPQPRTSEAPKDQKAIEAALKKQIEEWKKQTGGN